MSSGKPGLPLKELWNSGTRQMGDADFKFGTPSNYVGHPSASLGMLLCSHLVSKVGINGFSPDLQGMSRESRRKHVEAHRCSRCMNNMTESRRGCTAHTSDSNLAS